MGVKFFSFHIFLAFYAISYIFRTNKFSGRGGGGGCRWLEISGDRVALLMLKII